MRDHSRAGYRWRQSKCGVKARCVCDLMHPRFIQKIAWCWWRGGIEPKSWTREKLVPNPCVWISPHKKENATLFFFLLLRVLDPVLFQCQSHDFPINLSLVLRFFLLSFLLPKQCSSARTELPLKSKCCLERIATQELFLLPLGAP